MSWLDNKDEKKETNKDNKKDVFDVPKKFTIQGEKLGDVKTVRIYPGGHVKITNGGL